jgi:hypothetical protein
VPPIEPAPLFGQPLTYGSPSAGAWAGWIVMSAILGGYGLRVALWLLDQGATVPSPRLQQAAGVIGFVLPFALGIRQARPTLVLDRDRVKVPHWLGWRGIMWADVGAYDLTPTVVSLGRHGKLKGQMLTIRSRRPDVAMLQVLVSDRRPLDPALLARLDRAIAARGEGT